MKGKKIIIAITGSIAAYKIPMLIRLFVKAEAEVKVVMTPAAADFVSPLVLSTLSKNPVIIELATENEWQNHVMLGRWADLMLVAPASCNTIAKMANGICDNLLLAVYLSAICPVFIAPAMDEDMHNHPTFQRNISSLQSFGNHILKSEYGELASGLVGFGRMAEPEDIYKQVDIFFNQHKKLAGKIALVTAGPTYENIDPVRFIGNHSSGKMGIAIAQELMQQGAIVHLVLGPSNEKVDESQIKLTHVTSAQQMFDACQEIFPKADIAVMSAAVADYTPTEVASEKIKKKDGEMNIALTKTKDILKHLGEIKRSNQVLIGFALESKDERNYALKKLTEKNADAIVMNSIKDEGAGFGHDTNKITIFDKQGNETAYTLKSKKEVAKDIVQKIIDLLI